MALRGKVKPQSPELRQTGEEGGRGRKVSLLSGVGVERDLECLKVSVVASLANRATEIHNHGGLTYTLTCALELGFPGNLAVTLNIGWAVK